MSTRRSEPVAAASHGEVLLVSGPRTGSGGLFAVDGSNVETIDNLACQGLAYDGDRVYRIVSCNRQARPCSDLLVYDEHGIVATHRLDGLGQVHDVLPRRHDLLIVDTSGNCVRSLTSEGAIETWWRGTPLLDAWHINCLDTDAESNIVATAFGTFRTPYGWTERLSARTGVLVELPSENVLVSDLCQPHHPRRVDDGWLVCNSLPCELREYDEVGGLRRTLVLDGFTRGLALDERFLYVGESQPREQGFRLPRSRVSVVDRATWTVLDRIEIPAPEIYDIVPVPRSFVDGLRRGLGSGTVRALGPLEAFVRGRRAMWQISPSLPPAAMRARITADVPDVLPANSDMVVACVVENLSDARWCSAGPYPVELSYRWHDGSGEARKERVRVDLPRPVEAGDVVNAELMLCTPVEPGLYGLVITLIQKGVGWFDAADEAAADRHLVIIGDGVFGAAAEA